MHDVGLKVQSGTVPVERLWASALQMIPAPVRTMSSAWFHVLSNLMFLRYNYRHFNAAHLSDWSEGDSLLAERIDTLAFLAMAVQADDAQQDTSETSHLFEPFL